MNLKISNLLHRKLFWLIILIAASVYSLTLGVKDFSLLGLFTRNGEDIKLAIISRFPRLISILVTGASLSISGLIMQTITDNKFVSPSTAGTMEWSRFGVMIAIMFFGGEAKLFKMLIAFICSLFGTLIFLQILQTMKFKNAMIVPLVGMMLGNVISAITSFIAYRFDIIQNMSSWLQGNFSLVIKGRYELLYLGIPFLFIAYIYANKLTIAGMGESFSKSLGVNYKAIVLLGMVIVAVITSTVVVTVGSISFVGIIIPNIVSMMMGDNLRNSLPVTALFGALFLLICDMIGRVIIFPYEISISLIVSIVGSIMFLALLFRRKKKWSTS